MTDSPGDGRGGRGGERELAVIRTALIKLASGSGHQARPENILHLIVKEKSREILL